MQPPTSLSACPRHDHHTIDTRDIFPHRKEVRRHHRRRDPPFHRRNLRVGFRFTRRPLPAAQVTRFSFHFVFRKPPTITPTAVCQTVLFPVASRLSPGRIRVTRKPYGIQLNISAAWKRSSKPPNRMVWITALNAADAWQCFFCGSEFVPVIEVRDYFLGRRPAI